MFTGIVEELGRVEKISPRTGVVFLEVAAEKTLTDTKIGDSIAVNGVCLTVVKIGRGIFGFEMMRRTFTDTNLGLLRQHQAVNLERSLKAGERISGHFVLGHVDCPGLVRRKSMRQGSWEFEISVPAGFRGYCLPKGSIAVDGISLTISSVCEGGFKICVIPHTFKNTTLSFAGPSSRLNVEFDILAKRAKIQNVECSR
ncbi:MAG: riboflavin synthase [Candidatus Omnitrophica bacterium]|jgi:riboflavin synthase|nr:riboflavin synthase [Candidatus Omnitrophota bacterium]MDD3274135.1 riboflavin synthase [Candidatus Omnitrophota bacterium]MDD5077833.1 riboflavin synthase [Candidatus Omnitrophota bacterium]MDD5724522.1 riboflavin synthase [Candidatus Omnitrophota bacterium]